MILGWREVPGRLVHLNEAGDENSETALLYGRRVGDRVLVLGEGMHVAEDTGEALLTGLLSSLVFVALVGFVAPASLLGGSTGGCGEPKKLWQPTVAVRHRYAYRSLAPMTNLIAWRLP